MPNPTIINPAPFTAGAYAHFWVKRAFINFVGKTIAAQLSPWDGGANLSDTGQKDVNSNAAANFANAAIAAMQSECASLGAAATPPIPGGAVLEYVGVNGPAPASKVIATLIFDKGVVTIPDCISKAGTDATFASAFFGMMAFIASLAGTAVSGS